LIFKLTLSLRSGHCDYSSLAPKPN